MSVLSLVAQYCVSVVNVTGHWGIFMMSVLSLTDQVDTLEPVISGVD